MEIKVRGYGKSYRIQGLAESYNVGFDECNKMWKEKIQEKMKEIDKLYDNAETDEFGIKAFYGYDFIMDMLQELLGDEN